MILSHVLTTRRLRIVFDEIVVPARAIGGMADHRFLYLVDDGNIVFQGQIAGLADVVETNVDHVRDDAVDGKVAPNRLVLGEAKFLLHCNNRIVEAQDAQRIGQLGRYVVFGSEAGFDRLANGKMKIVVQFLCWSTAGRRTGVEHTRGCRVILSLS